MGVAPDYRMQEATAKENQIMSGTSIDRGKTRMLFVVTLTAINVMGPVTCNAAEKEVRQTRATDAALEDALYTCLFEKFDKPKITLGRVTGHSVHRDPIDHSTAYDDNTGRNFFYDKKTKTWKDGKTGESVTPKNLEDALYCCLFTKFDKPEITLGRVTGHSVHRDPLDHSTAYDDNSGRNFFWDKDQQAWRDGKTGECICPKCAEQPKQSAQPPPPSGPNAGNVLKSIASHVNVGVGVSGGGGEDRHHHADDRRRADEKLRRDEKRLHGDEARKEEKHRAEEKVHDNRVMIAHDPQIQRAEEELERLQKKKAELERRHRETKDKDEKKMLERQIKGYDTLIEHEQAKLNQAR